MTEQSRDLRREDVSGGAVVEVYPPRAPDLLLVIGTWVEDLAVRGVPVRGLVLARC